MNRNVGSPGSACSSPNISGGRKRSLSGSCLLPSPAEVAKVAKRVQLTSPRRPSAPSGYSATRPLPQKPQTTQTVGHGLLPKPTLPPPKPPPRVNRDRPPERTPPKPPAEEEGLSLGTWERATPTSKVNSPRTQRGLPVPPVVQGRCWAPPLPPRGTTSGAQVGARRRSSSFSSRPIATTERQNEGQGTRPRVVSQATTSAYVFERARTEVLCLMTTALYPRWLEKQSLPFRGAKPTFQKVLETSSLRESFRVFLQGEYAAENLSFWEETGAFAEASGMTPQEVKLEALRIFSKYLDDDSELQVNVSAEVSNKLRDDLFSAASHAPHPPSCAATEARCSGPQSQAVNPDRVGQPALEATAVPVEKRTAAVSACAPSLVPSAAGSGPPENMRAKAPARGGADVSAHVGDLDGRRSWSSRVLPVPPPKPGSVTPPPFVSRSLEDRTQGMQRPMPLTPPRRPSGVAASTQEQVRRAISPQLQRRQGPVAIPQSQSNSELCHEIMAGSPSSTGSSGHEGQCQPRSAVHRASGGQSRSISAVVSDTQSSPDARVAGAGRVTPMTQLRLRQLTKPPREEPAVVNHHEKPHGSGHSSHRSHHSHRSNSRDRRRSRSCHHWCCPHCNESCSCSSSTCSHRHRSSSHGMPKSSPRSEHSPPHHRHETAHSRGHCHTHDHDRRHATSVTPRSSSAAQPQRPHVVHVTHDGGGNVRRSHSNHDCLHGEESRGHSHSHHSSSHHNHSHHHNDSPHSAHHYHHDHHHSHHHHPTRPAPDDSKTPCDDTFSSSEDLSSPSQ